MFSAVRIWLKPLGLGVLASFLLTFFYFVILTVLNSFSHALMVFYELWYLMLPLIVGFGLQIVLFVYIRAAHRHSLCDTAETAAAGGASAASGTVSGVSMVACCMHHVTDVLPLLGLSAAVIFINRFQSFFLLLGVFSGIAGSLMMLRIIQKHHLYSKQQTVMVSLMRWNWALTLQAVLILAAISLAITLAIAV